MRLNGWTSLLQLGIVGLLRVGSLQAQGEAWICPPPPYEEIMADFLEWQVDFENRARDAGITPATLEQVRPHMIYNPEVIVLDRKQYTSPQSIEDCLEKAAKVVRAKMPIIRQHRALLQKMGQKYGVDPEYIAAIWITETRCGERMGKMPVVSSLATLCYEGRRRAFFEKELMAMLRLVQAGKLDPATTKGAWAGDMGQCQFLPSSVERFGVDEDQDGRIDLWRSWPDILGSIANYLKQYGWEKGRRWGYEVQVPRALYDQVRANSKDFKEPKTLKVWRQKGVRLVNGKPLPGAPDLPAVLTCPNSKSGQAYLLYPNGQVLKEYNLSTFYVVSVAQGAARLAPIFKKGRP